MKIRIALLVAGCAMVLCLPFVVSSKDNPAQAKAREAVRGATPPPKTAEKPVEPATPTAAPKPAESKPAFAVTAGAEDTEAQAKARKALREDTMAPVPPAPVAVAPAPIATTPTPSTTVPAPVASSAGPSPQGLAAAPRPDNEAQARARAVLREEAAVVAATEEAPPAEQATPEVAGSPLTDTEAQTKARQALHEQPAAAVAAAAPAPAPGAAVPEPKPVKRQTAPKKSTRVNPLFEGLDMPEPAFTPEQEAALAELLDPYNKDQISTEEYHLKRSAIIAGS